MFNLFKFLICVEYCMCIAMVSCTRAIYKAYPTYLDFNHLLTFTIAYIFDKHVC